MRRLPSAAATAGTIGATANAGIGYGVNGTVDPNDVLFAFWSGAFTANTGAVATIGWNAASGAASSYLKGDDPLTGGALSGVSAGFGYGAGKIVQGTLGNVFNPNWKNYEWSDIGLGISKPLPQSLTPGIAGNISNSIITESSGQTISNGIDKLENNNQ
ncbi:adhesin [Yersinia mollaretii]|uniref:adhesin n=1 Tax=Yersinia mollaretii TaxID=33060 RepID=UPI00119F0AC5|nr:adhesin [Yersinia mollaretii]